MRVEKHLLFWLTALAALIGIMALLREIIFPFVAAAVIAYFLSPIADRLERIGLNRAVSAIAILSVGTLLVAMALVLLVPALIDQARQLVAAMPGEMQRLRQVLEELAGAWLGPNTPAVQEAFDRMMSEVSKNWTNFAGTVLVSIWSRGLALVNLVALLLITPVVVFYLLLDWNRMLERIDAALPRDYAPTIRRLAGEINDAVSAFIRGQGAICLMLGMFYALGLTWVGINYGLLIGLTTGLLAFIPIVGWVLGLLCASGVALVQFWPDPTPLAKVVGVMVAGIAVDTAILSPRFVGQKVGLHPVWLIFALFVFSYLLGLVGTLVAVPLAAAIAVLVRFAIDAYLHSSVYKGALGGRGDTGGGETP